MLVVGGHPAAKESPVVGRVVDDVLVAARHVGAVRVAGVVEAAVGVDPEDEIGG
jgi:hypothetical protein